MSLVDFLWLLPGFIFLQTSKQSHTIDRVQSETRYILNLLFASAIFGLLARGLILLISIAGIVAADSQFRTFWHKFLPAPFTATLAIAAFLAVVVGRKVSSVVNGNSAGFKRSKCRTLTRIKISILRTRSAVCSWLRKFDLIDDFLKCYFATTRTVFLRAHRWFYPERRDAYFRTIMAVLGETAYLTTTKGRIYIGVVIDADIDPNETKQFIRIVPLVSGHKDNSIVKFTTIYKENFEALGADDGNHVSFTIEFSNIETLGMFSKTLHERLAEEGRIVYEWKQTP